MKCDEIGMERVWFDRLEELIRDDGRSLRKISEEAGCGPNFVQQLIKERKDPRASQLSRLLDVLGPGASLYVINGLKLCREDIEILNLVNQLDVEGRRKFTDLVLHISETDRQQGREPEN